MYEKAIAVDWRNDPQTAQPSSTVRGDPDERPLAQSVSSVVESAQDLFTTLRERIVDALTLGGADADDGGEDDTEDDAKPDSGDGNDEDEDDEEDRNDDDGDENEDDD